jgi:hypothetical protein
VEVLPPGMQDREEPDRRAQTFGVGRDSEQRFRSGPEQDAIDLARILKRQTADLLGERKYNVEIGDRQQFGLPLCQPLCARRCLTLWAMSVATRNGELSITCLMGSLF